MTRNILQGLMLVLMLWLYAIPSWGHNNEDGIRWPNLNSLEKNKEMMG